MPGQHTNYIGDTYDFPRQFPQSLTRYQEEPGLSWAEIDRRPGTCPYSVARSENRRWEPPKRQPLDAEAPASAPPPCPAEPRRSLPACKTSSFCPEHRGLRPSRASKCFGSSDEAHGRGLSPSPNLLTRLLWNYIGQASCSGRSCPVGEAAVTDSTGGRPGSPGPPLLNNISGNRRCPNSSSTAHNATGHPYPLNCQPEKGDTRYQRARLSMTIQTERQ